jgi:hypothetical protein
VLSRKEQSRLVACVVKGWVGRNGRTSAQRGSCSGVEKQIAARGVVRAKGDKCQTHFAIIC